MELLVIVVLVSYRDQPSSAKKGMRETKERLDYCSVGILSMLFSSEQKMKKTK